MEKTFSIGGRTISVTDVGRTMKPQNAFTEKTIRP